MERSIFSEIQVDNLLQDMSPESFLSKKSFLATSRDQMDYQLTINHKTWFHTSSVSSLAVPPVQEHLPDMKPLVEVEEMEHPSHASWMMMVMVPILVDIGALLLQLFRHG